MNSDGSAHGLYATDVVQLMLSSIDKLAVSHHKTNEKVDKLIEAMGKQEVILEKMSNIEKSHAETTQRIYKVIDSNAERCNLDDVALSNRLFLIEKKCEINTEELIHRAKLDEKFLDVSNKVEQMNFVLILAQYPKLALTLIAVLYIIAIKDVRDILLQFIGVM